ncbi:MAG: isoprenylcysteine carboxylmethyltransferase family protein [Alphaproteobacteria bacterium]|nr:isoprenylcysteine carboxylmethyltransferase family protein [Alphaproteobacteria bacterium]
MASSATPNADAEAAQSLVRRPSFMACLAAIRAPELYRNFAIHIFVMFPAAMVMCWLGTKVDAAVGLGPLLEPAVRVPAGLSLIGAGGFWVWYVYGYLFLAGGGSPGTHVDGGPVAMVDTGPYTMIRHPSVLGKLAGVIGLGIIWGSPSFLAFFVPVLLVYSLVTNRYLQERFCEERFGPRYAAYRERVPMLLPRPAGMARWLRDEAALAEADAELPPPVEAQPPGVWSEFRWYLLGLAGLISLFAGIWWAVS